MDISSGARAATATAGVAAAGGVALTFYGVRHELAAHSVAGVLTIVIAVAVIVMVVVHAWVTDTSTERIALAAAQREAQAERTRYIAAQAALENEQARLNRDMATERARIARNLIREREATRAEFEERRAVLVSETMEATFMMIRDGKFAAEPPAANLIPFPEARPGRASERERSREHGALRP